MMIIERQIALNPAVSPIGPSFVCGGSAGLEGECEEFKQKGMLARPGERPRLSGRPIVYECAAFAREAAGRLHARFDRAALRARLQ